MLRNLFKASALVFLGTLFLYSCQQSDLGTDPEQKQQSPSLTDAEFSKDVNVSTRSLKGAFVHAPIIIIDGEEYYFAPGAPDGPNGAPDIPGHYWKQVTRNKVLGKHYNTGPFGKPSWWSSDAGDGVLLFRVNAIIDSWSMEKAKRYAKIGFIHYHEFVKVSDGSYHPTKVAWLQHIAVRSFTLDGGPHPELSHEVEPGIDWEFIPNGMMPYDPEN